MRPVGVNQTSKEDALPPSTRRLRLPSRTSAVLLRKIFAFNQTLHRAQPSALGQFRT